ANAGEVTFTYTSTDSSGAAHNLYLAPPKADGSPDTSKKTVLISAPVFKDGGARTAKTTLAAGTYVLYCAYIGHEAMVVTITIV
ncbi:MAG: hypothetical protein AAGC46_07015, partial [Solirubrobacteraceae bacterium]